MHGDALIGDTGDLARFIKKGKEAKKVRTHLRVTRAVTLTWHAML